MNFATLSVTWWPRFSWPLFSGCAHSRQTSNSSNLADRSVSGQQQPVIRSPGLTLPATANCTQHVTSSGHKGVQPARVPVPDLERAGASCCYQKLGSPACRHLAAM